MKCVHRLLIQVCSRDGDEQLEFSRTVSIGLINVLFCQFRSKLVRLLCLTRNPSGKMFYFFGSKYVKTGTHFSLEVCKPMFLLTFFFIAMHVRHSYISPTNNIMYACMHIY